MTLVQYSAESCQSQARPAPLNARNDTAEPVRPRQSRRSRKNSANAAGVSFTAAAKPVSVPRGQRVPGSRQSSVTSAISATLTWP